MDNTTAIVLKGVIEDFPSWRKELDEYVFTDTVNSVDGVLYPGIGECIPPEIAMQVEGAVQSALGAAPCDGTMFLRLSVEGVDAPHQVHTDISMGTHAMIVYLTRQKYCQGGTSIMTHVSGIRRRPDHNRYDKVLQKHSNMPEKWNTIYTCEMQENGALIIPADLFHRSEPPSGFGDSPANGRLVLVYFFNLEQG